MMKARSYQEEAVHKTLGYFYTHKTGNPVIAMPTGTGKSVVIALLLWMIFSQWPNQKVLVLTHVKELIDQNFRKLLQVWPQAPAGIYSSGLNRRDYAQAIIFAGIASVAKKFDLFGKVDLIIIDECHLLNSQDSTMYFNFIAALMLINPKLRVIGLSATPYRLGQGMITDGGLFTDICFDITGMAAFNRLIAEGYLCPLIPKATNTKLDIDGVHTRGGDFVQSELQRAINRDDITKAAVQEAIQIGADRQSWLVFCSGVEHCVDAADIMNDMGIPTVAIHSRISTAQRDDYIEGFKAGEYRAATNNNVLTTGFDHPPIDLILALRPTISPGLWVQMLGRGTRPYDPANPGDVNPHKFPDKKFDCLVLDFAGNTRRLGPINDPVVPRKKGDKTGPAPVKECEFCGTLVHASLRRCNVMLPAKGNPEANADGFIQCPGEFTFETKLTMGASTEQIIKGDMPVVEVFQVDSVTYSTHNKVGKPPAVRVSYFCGLRKFSEFVCIEHDGYAARKAREWWRKRSADPVPESTEDLLQVIDALPVVTHLRIWENKKPYPEIMAECFDGTAFGTQQDTGVRPVADVTANTALGRVINPGLQSQQDEEFPF